MVQTLLAGVLVRPRALGFDHDSAGKMGVDATTQSDIYSLAMVIIEVTYRVYAHFFQILTGLTLCSKVFTGKIPFLNINNVHVLISVSRGNRPPKPPGGEVLDSDQWFGNSPRNVGTRVLKDDWISIASYGVSKQSLTQVCAPV